MSTNDTSTSPQGDPLLDLPADMFRTGDTVKQTVIEMLHGKKADSASDFPIEFVNYTEVDNFALFEGDIILADLETILLPVKDRGISILGDKYRWANGLIPYTTDNAVRERVEAAIAHWVEKTPIRFKPQTIEADYVSFIEGSGCASSVGRQGGIQYITLSDNCSVGSAIHEIGHTLGLWHEQSRSDREDFIEIITENIIPKALHNFDEHDKDGQDLGDYDYGSIMHYPATAFSKNGKETIRAKNGASIGQRNGLSTGDIAAIRAIYPNLNWT